MSDASDRSIPATPRRRQMAERQGMLPTAVLPSWGASMAVALLLLPGWWRATVAAATEWIRLSLASPQLDPAGTGNFLPIAVLLPTLAVIGASAATAVALRMILDGFTWRPGRIAPDVMRINPLAGLRRIFSTDTLLTIAANALWLGLLATTAGWSIGAVRRLAGPVADGDGFLAIPAAARDLVPVLAATGIVVSCRWLLLRRAAERRIRMTPEELREEMRSLESPQPIRWGRSRPSRSPSADAPRQELTPGTLQAAAAGN